MDEEAFWVTGLDSFEPAIFCMNVVENKDEMREVCKNEERNEEDEVNFQRKDASENDASKK